MSSSSGVIRGLVPQTEPGTGQQLEAILPEGRIAGDLPPVDQWDPPGEQDIGMEIRADGSWWHEGRAIRRERLVRLFARILRRDPDGRHFLVTPVEKVVVHVEDAPFVAGRLDVIADDAGRQVIAFTTTLGDVTHAGPQKPIRVGQAGAGAGGAPYVLVRGGLEARISRPVYYELIGLAQPCDQDPDLMGVWSSGVFFPLGHCGQAGHGLD